METFNTSEGADFSSTPKSSTRLKYERSYRNFKSWLQEKNLTISEESILSYFQEKTNSFKTQSSYWGEYCGLKSTILTFDGIDISQFKGVLQFVKMQKSEEPPKKSKAFSREEINRFLIEAPDDEYLLLKAVMIIGIAGGCRRDELTNMSIDDISDKGSVMTVNVPGSNERSFTILDLPESEIQFLPYVRKYIHYRPENASTRRLFYSMRKGVCVNQVVGINTIAQYPAKIAEFLQLENPREYTGNAFRRTYIVLYEQKQKFNVL